MAVTPTSTRYNGPLDAVRPRGLLDWVEDPRAGHGVRFLDDRGEWELWEYPRLASLVAAAAEQVAEARVRPEGVVSIVTSTGPEFIAAFYGTLLAGNVPSPLALPLVMRDKQQYVEHAAGILKVADPVLMLADDAVKGLMEPAAELAGLEHGPQPLRLDGGDASAGARGPAADLGLLQFTSGSSGRPRGVRVTRRNLETNVAQIQAWLRLGPEDEVVSWLPLYHDMGLIGCLMTPVANQSDVSIMRPDQFVRDPFAWLDCFGRRGAAVAVAPNFGYAYMAKRLTPEALEGMDFGAWRAACTGAERCDPEVFGRFAKLLEPYGFRAAAYNPGYGLAEATLAVTATVLEEAPRAVKLDWTRAHLGDRVAIVDEATVAEPERIGSGEGWVMGCGPPYPGVSVFVVGEDGAELGDGFLGEIAVEGETIADGYTGGERPGSTRFEDGRLLTGDAGFTLDGELFVVGRLGDSVKVRGRTVFVEDVEAELATIDGVGKGKCVVLAGNEGGRNVLAAVVEAPAGPWVDEMARALRSEVGAEAGVKVLAGGSRTILRTSSGKPRRRVMWQSLVDGDLPAELLHDSSSS